MIPKKSLGQHFLTNETIAKQIAESADLSSSDNVLEIGPGKGILTKYLAEKAGKVLAVEIDESLATLLKTKLIISSKSCRTRKCTNENNYSNADIIEGDILKINLPRLIEENNFANYKVIANLPYYITSKIIRLLLETKYPPTEMVLMVQKEVGERIIALDGKESILSISVKFYAEPEILFYVPRENFDPAPEVDSVVIRIKRKPARNASPACNDVATSGRHGDAGGEKIPDVNIEEFFSLIRAGFSSKRKMLINNLSAFAPRAKLSEVIKKAGLEPGIRAEKLKVEDWVKLFNIIESRN
jgi:16S rRNA (adenine1518-N6/adenine1519-N6)-dimethyltransferase